MDRVVALGLLLVLGGLGLGLVGSIFVLLLALFLGFLGFFTARGWVRSEELREEFAELEWKAGPGLASLLRRVPPYKTRCPHIQVPSQNIEASLQEIVSLVLRDFVDPWYGILTIDESFKDSLRSSSNQIASVLSQCLGGVSWEQLLTQDIVDDFASHIRLYRKARERLAKSEEADGDLESIFFDLELEMEKNYCRDLVSTSPKYENAYLHDLADAVMYLVIPGEDFRCRPLRFLLREVLVKRLLVPLVEQLSDPDFINHFIVWLLNEVEVSPEDFLWIVDGSSSEEELVGLLEAVEEHSALLRARDTGGEDDSIVKAQLGSLNFVSRSVASSLRRLRKEGKPEEAEERLQSAKLHLSLPFILNNNVSLSYFIDFLATVNGQAYIDLYLAIEGFKVSVEHQLSAVRLKRMTGAGVDPEVVETIKEAGASLAHQYLYSAGSNAVKLEPALLQRVAARLKEEPSENVFDEVRLKRMTGAGVDPEVVETIKEAGASLAHQYLYSAGSNAVKLEPALLQRVAARLKEEPSENVFDEVRLKRMTGAGVDPEVVETIKEAGASLAHQYLYSAGSNAVKLEPALLQRVAARLKEEPSENVFDEVRLKRMTGAGVDPEVVETIKEAGASLAHQYLYSAGSNAVKLEPALLQRVAARLKEEPSENVFDEVRLKRMTGAGVDPEVVETIKEAGASLAHQYLYSAGSNAVKLEPALLQRVAARLKEEPSENVFDEVRLKRMTGAGVDPEVVETIKEAGASLAHQYLYSAGSNAVKLEPALLQRVAARLKEEPSENVFDEVQHRVFQILETDVRFFPAFRQNPLFFRMLADLALINRDGERVRNLEVSDCQEAADGSFLRSSSSAELLSEYSEEPQMEAVITTLGIGREGATAFALYQIHVSRCGDEDGSWNVQRRYSDFHTLNALVESRFPNLASLGFPGKKTFNNLNHEFLERRKKALNTYLRALLLPEVLRQNPGLDLIVMDFLCQKDYSPDKGPLSKKMQSLVRPIRSGARTLGAAVTAVPDKVLEGVVSVGGGLGKVGSVEKVTKSVLGVGRLEEDTWVVPEDEGRVGANLGPDSIPLRILLLLVDEIFGLRQRNQWFRRRLVAFLRQLINATLGQSLNRKIVDFVNWLTSEEQVVEYLKTLKATVWPAGVLFEPAVPRPPQIQVRSRLAAKAAMFSALPDELRLFIGSETTRSGTELVFDALQSPALNKRLVYVLLERLLLHLFPHNSFPSLLARLHSKSPRCRASPSKTS